MVSIDRKDDNGGSRDIGVPGRTRLGSRVWIYSLQDKWGEGGREALVGRLRVLYRRDQETYKEVGLSQADRDGNKGGKARIRRHELLGMSNFTGGLRGVVKG